MSVLVQSVITEMDFVPYEQATIGSRSSVSLHDKSALDFRHGNDVVSVQKRRNSIRLQIGNLLKKITRSSFTSQPSCASNDLQPSAPLGSNRLLLLAEVRSHSDLTFTYSNVHILPSSEKNTADCFCSGSSITQLIGSDARWARVWSFMSQFPIGWTDKW